MDTDASGCITEGGERQRREEEDDDQEGEERSHEGDESVGEDEEEGEDDEEDEEPVLKYERTSREPVLRTVSSNLKAWRLRYNTM